MKNTFKVLWMTAIVAVVGFSFASCISFGGSGEDNGNGGLGRMGAMGAMAPAEWPSSDVWEQNGVAGGLQQPSGTTVTMVHTGTYAGMVVFSVGLEKANRAAFDNLVSQVERKGWTVYEKESSRREEAISFVKGNNGIVISFNIRDNEVGIMASPNAHDD